MSNMGSSSKIGIRIGSGIDILAIFTLCLGIYFASVSRHISNEPNKESFTLKPELNNRPAYSPPAKPIANFNEPQPTEENAEPFGDMFSFLRGLFANPDAFTGDADQINPHAKEASNPRAFDDASTPVAKFTQKGGKKNMKEKKAQPPVTKSPAKDNEPETGFLADAELIPGTINALSRMLSDSSTAFEALLRDSKPSEDEKRVSSSAVKGIFADAGVNVLDEKQLQQLWARLQKKLGSRNRDKEDVENDAIVVEEKVIPENVKGQTEDSVESVVEDTIGLVRQVSSFFAQFLATADLQETEGDANHDSRENDNVGAKKQTYIVAEKKEQTQGSKPSAAIPPEQVALQKAWSFMHGLLASSEFENAKSTEPIVKADTKRPSDKIQVKEEAPKRSAAPSHLETVTDELLPHIDKLVPLLTKVQAMLQNKSSSESTPAQETTDSGQADTESDVGEAIIAAGNQFLSFLKTFAAA